MRFKWVKRFLSLAAVCGAVAGVVYYFKKQSSDQDDEFADDFEDEDFDLDSDLKPVSDREYVPLNAGKTEEASGEASEKSEDAAPEDSSDSDKGEGDKGEGNRPFLSFGHLDLLGVHPYFARSGT